MKLDKNIENLQGYMANQLWLVEGEKIHEVEVPGEGNMNFTLRLKTNQRSVIIKQSRAYVEKYPQVAAPKKRALMEAAFYQEICKSEKLKAQMPRVRKCMNISWTLNSGDFLPRFITALLNNRLRYRPKKLKKPL